MNKKKYTLPYGIVLSNQVSRYYAFFVDLLINLVLGVVFLLFVVNPLVFNNITGDLTMKVYNYEIDSHLVYYDEDSEKVSIYKSDDDYLVFQEPMTYFYFEYMTGNALNLADPAPVAPNYNDRIEINDTYILPKDYYTIEWYNKNILGITSEDPDSEKNTGYFTYQRNSDGTYNKSVLGIPKTERWDTNMAVSVEITPVDLVYYYDEYYVQSYNVLTSQDFYLEVSNPLNFWNSQVILYSFLGSSLIIYLLIPLFLKNGATLGKKIFSIGLANIDGYQYNKISSFTRTILLFITLIIAFTLFWWSYYAIFIICSGVFVISWGLYMASPKKTSLHDLIGRTIVVDLKNSTIYKNEVEASIAFSKMEDKYIEVNDENEEPEISYEK